MNYYERALELKDETIANRRHIHKNAETGLDLPKTKAYVMEKLTEYGLEPKDCGYGVTATLGKGGKVLLLRADMDALPMPEESGEEFAWKAMVIATGLVAIPMAVMGAMTNSGASIVIYFVALAITGIAESFRAVSITPTAQGMLAPEDMGVGTSLVNFANSLAGTIAAAVFAVAYNASTAADPTNVALIQSGVKSVFWTAAVVLIIGLLLVLFIVKPQMSKKAEGSK